MHLGFERVGKDLKGFMRRSAVSLIVVTILSECLVGKASIAMLSEASKFDWLYG